MSKRRWVFIKFSGRDRGETVLGQAGWSSAFGEWDLPVPREWLKRSVSSANARFWFRPGARGPTKAPCRDRILYGYFLVSEINYLSL